MTLRLQYILMLDRMNFSNPGSKHGKWTAVVSVVRGNTISISWPTDVHGQMKRVIRFQAYGCFTNRTNKKINFYLLRARAQIRLLLEVILTPSGFPHCTIEMSSHATLEELRQCWMWVQQWRDGWGLCQEWSCHSQGSATWPWQVQCIDATRLGRPDTSCSRSARWKTLGLMQHQLGVWDMCQQDTMPTLTSLSLSSEDNVLVSVVKMLPSKNSQGVWKI